MRDVEPFTSLLKSRALITKRNPWVLAILDCDYSFGNAGANYLRY